MKINVCFLQELFALLVGRMKIMCEKTGWKVQVDFVLLGLTRFSRTIIFLVTKPYHHVALQLLRRF